MKGLLRDKAVEVRRQIAAQSRSTRMHLSISGNLPSAMQADAHISHAWAQLFKASAIESCLRIFRDSSELSAMRLNIYTLIMLADDPFRFT